MQQLTQFMTTHWQLWVALVIILVLILINELITQKKRAKTLSTSAMVEMINHQNAAVIDLRGVDAFRAGHIIDSIVASDSDFQSGKMDKYKTKPMILVCAKGFQSAALATKLRAQGFTEAMSLFGGMAAWQAANLPLVKGK